MYSKIHKNPKKQNSISLMKNNKITNNKNNSNTNNIKNDIKYSNKLINK